MLCLGLPEGRVLERSTPISIVGAQAEVMQILFAVSNSGDLTWGPHLGIVGGQHILLDTHSAKRAVSWPPKD